MNPLVQFLLSLLAGAFLFLLAVGHDYWKRLRWLFGWGPNLGHESADKLISIANRTVLVTAALLLVWAVTGPSPYRRNWEMEVWGLAAGTLIAYVALILSASTRARA
ncbi:hypothetical protein [uncultured Stenotrophomonas sp.]|uniref:hypothetical protein n=1 Tax=uncultured Stenotrophomonas sp. TaxID=165438 RepID=UPI00258B48A5|nr:hypothetical protein [uncultured Stenotrophomonas sp.]